MKWKTRVLLLSILILNVSSDALCQDQSLADSLLTRLYNESDVADSVRFQWLSKISFNHNNPDSALFYAQLLGSETDNIRYLFEAGYNEGSARRLLGDLDGSLQTYFKALNYAIEGGLKTGEGLCYVAIGDIYSISEARNNSIKYYLKAIDILRGLKDSVNLATALINIGDEYLNQDSLENAMKYFQESQVLFEQLNYKAGTAYNLGNIGIVHARQGNDEYALSTINEAIEILEPLGDYYAISVFLTYLSDIYADQGDYDQSLLYLWKSLELATSYGLKDQISDANLKLSEIYDYMGNTEKSYSHYKAHVAYRDSVNNLAVVQQMADMRTEFEVSQKQIEVDLLNQEKKSQRVTIFSVITISILLGLLAFGLYRRYVFTRKTKNIIEKQKERSDNLLLNILPEKTAEELKNKGSVMAQRFDSVTVMFTDFKGFTSYAEKLSPESLVQVLDFYFSEFDKILDNYGIEKIKTIGDAYMCVCGLPEPVDDHALKIVQAAYDILEFVERVKKDGNNNLAKFDIRIGIHTGSVIAGVVGTKKFTYDIWGDSVNIASRMESASEPGKINITEHTYEIIKDYCTCSYRGEIAVKNRGNLKMYYVDSISGKLV